MNDAREDGLPARITFKPQYNTDFVKVARRIAKDEPPLWLLVGLTHFSADIGNDTSEHTQFAKEIIGQMSDAATVLLRWLPVFGSGAYGVQCPEHVRAVLALLPRIKAHLDWLSKPHIGRPKDERRDVCAAVVVEAWQLLHGKVQRRSEELYEVCNDYWRACGGEEIGETGDLLNWRRAVKATENAEWVRSGLLAMKAIPELDRPAVQNST
jgi:hypothetical protein